MIKTILIVIIGANLLGCSATKGVIAYENPGEEFITISGTVDSSFSYKFRVGYTATAPIKACQNYNIMTDRYVAQEINYDYFPTIVSNQHSLHVPLKELVPDTVCKWKPGGASLCLSERDGVPTQCTSIFSFRRQHDVNSKTTMHCGASFWCSGSPENSHTYALSEFNKNYIVDILLK